MEYSSFNSNLCWLLRGSFWSGVGRGVRLLPILSKTSQDYARNIKFCCYWWKIKKYGPWIQISDCSQSSAQWKYGNVFIICSHEVIVIFLNSSLVSFLKFRYLSKFYVNIITDSRIIFICTFFDQKSGNWKDSQEHFAAWQYPSVRAS